MKKDQQQNIIQEAYKLFLNKGYNETSMQDIIEVSNISKGGIYYYFKSKEEILEKAIDLQLQELFERIKEIFAKEELDPSQKLKLCIESKTEFFIQKFDIIKEIYSQDKHLIVRHFVSKKIKENIHPYVIKNFEEGKEKGFFDFEYSKEAMNIFLSAHDFIFNYNQEVIKDKETLQRNLLAIKSIADKIFNF